MTPTVTTDIGVVVRGHVPPGAAAVARRKMAALARWTREPIIHARVRLTRMGDPAIPRPVIARGSLAIAGRPVHARVAASTAHEAIDLLQAKLRRRLVRLARHRRAQPREWPTRDPGCRELPVVERRIVRHKAYAVARATPDEAAVDMDLMGYDFHLFTDDRTGQDAVVYRAGHNGYRLVDRPPVRLHLPEALARLDATGPPFLFYANAATGRGRVLYRRRDGHYGLVTPAD